MAARIAAAQIWTLRVGIFLLPLAYSPFTYDSYVLPKLVIAAATYGGYQPPPFPSGIPIADAHGLWYSAGSGIVLFANNSWYPMSRVGGQLAGPCL